MQPGGNKIKCITFDLDDTLWHCATVIHHAESVFFRWLGQHFPSIAADFNVDSLAHHRREYFLHHPEMSHDFSWLRKKWLTQLFRDYQCDEQLVEQGFQVFLHARNDITLFDGAEEVLERVKGNYLCGSITNGNADVHLVGIGQFFDFSITAAEAGAAKPSPVIFQAAVEAANMEPGNILHVGDDVDRDMRGAAEAGMHTLWVNLSGTPWVGNDKPTAEIRTISELAPFLFTREYL